MNKEGDVMKILTVFWVVLYKSVTSVVVLQNSEDDDGKETS